MMEFARSTVLNAVPQMEGMLQYLAGIVDLNTRRLEPIEM